MFLFIHFETGVVITLQSYDMPVQKTNFSYLKERVRQTYFLSFNPSLVIPLFGKDG